MSSYRNKVCNKMSYGSGAGDLYGT
jgi:hypothetical protein